MERLFKVFFIYLQNLYFKNKTKKKIADADDDGKINLNEFRKCIRDKRIDVTDSEIDIIFSLFDIDESGNINFFDFLHSLKG